jgi:phosphatidylserine decarboxylase
MVSCDRLPPETEGLERPGKPGKLARIIPTGATASARGDEVMCPRHPPSGVSGFAPRSGRLALAALALGSLLATAVRQPRRVALAVGGLLAAGVLAFHRDPDRNPPNAGVLAPADGTVSVIRTEEHDGEARVRVGIYMSARDVHVNRAPLPGTVREVEHVDGAHRLAFSKESDRNERVHVRVDGDDGDYTVTLIAGAFARRIHPYVEGGDRLDRGDRISHVSFGSRADVLLPAGVRQEDVLVETGEATRAGETRLGDI